MNEEFYDYEDVLTPEVDKQTLTGLHDEDDNNEPSTWWFGHFGNNNIRDVEARITGPRVVRTGRFTCRCRPSIPDSATFATKWILL